MPKTVPQAYGEASGALTVYVAGVDFALPNYVQVLDEVGISVSGDMCCAYGNFTFVKRGPDIPVIEVPLVKEVVPMWEVNRGVPFDTPASPGVTLIAIAKVTTMDPPLLLLRRADGANFASGATFYLGQFMWTRK